VLVGGLAEFALGDRPAGQRAGAFLDVLLGVMADAEREQFHQFAGQVLVGMLLAIGRSIEPDQDCRIAHHGVEQFAERFAAQRAEQFVLPPHDAEILDLDGAGGEVIVPQERQSLAERIGTKKHPINPPCFQPSPIRGGVEQQRRRLLELGGHTLAARGAGQQSLDARSRAVFQIALNLAPRRGEAGPAMQVDHAAQVPGRFLAWRVGTPEVSGIGSFRVIVHGFAFASFSGTSLLWTSARSLDLPASTVTSSTWAGIVVPGWISPTLKARL
jgi:hypothetical protein